ncbi:MAG TPA: protein adenylyltransferase SelO family protein, partial [Saprospiraceae bacterium]|nr:protein adenylyltransferase SelO family protein [Saprospiraceae bacterium]
INAEMTSQEARSLIEPALYNELIDAHEDLLIAWLETYLIRLKQETVASQVRKSEMSKVNPKYVLRNYMAQLAIEAAESGDYSLIHEIYTMLKHPYDEQHEFHYWFAKRPEWAMNKVGCSMLSCSS